MFTLRRTLTGLFLLLGLGLCISVAFQAWTAFDQYRGAQALTMSNLAREQLARAGMAIAEERTEAYLSLLGASTVERTAAELREAANAVLQEAAGTLPREQQGTSDAVLAGLREALDALRDTVDARRSMVSAQIRAASATEVLAGYSQVMEDLVALRLALLLQEHPADPGTANAFQMRRYATILLESLMQNEALIGGLLVERSPEAERVAWDQIRGNAERAELAFELLENRTDTSARPVRFKLASLAVAYEERYRPLEQELLASLLDQVQAPGQEGIRSAFGYPQVAWQSLPAA